MAISEHAYLTSAAGTALRQAFRGRLITAADEDYEQARKVWNGQIDKSPALIAACTGVDDVVAALRFAREEGLLVAVRGGGHSFAGFSTCDGGIVIDLSPMTAVSVDPDARVARAEGGVTWGIYDAATHAHGLASPGGLMSTTGIAGLTLGGGIGWLNRKYGLACDNLLGVEMVTAGGELVRASATENAELFWALRGGGGNFGIVTSFEYRLHPVSTVVGGLMLFRGEQTPDVLRLYRDYVSTCPDELGTMLSAITAPPVDFVPADMQGRPSIAFAGCHCGDPADAERALKPLRDLGPAVDLFDVIPYPDMQKMFDEDLPHGIRCYLKAGYLPEMSDGAIEVIAEYTRPLSSPNSTFDVHDMGGAVKRVAEDVTAFGDRRSAFCFNIVGLWNEASEDEVHKAYVRNFAAGLEPFGTDGVYVNFIADPDRVRAAYDDAKYARLQAVKRQYDPENLFRLNQNIQP